MKGDSATATPHISVNIAGRSVNALLDTAATHSFAKPSIVQRMTSHSDNSALLGDNSSQMNITGTGIVNMRIGNKVVEIPVFIAPDLREDLILGMPFFINQNAVLNIERRCLHIGKDNRFTFKFISASANQRSPTTYSGVNPSPPSCRGAPVFQLQVPEATRQKIATQTTLKERRTQPSDVSLQQSHPPQARTRQPLQTYPPSSRANWRQRSRSRSEVRRPWRLTQVANENQTSDALEDRRFDVRRKHQDACSVVSARQRVIPQVEV